MSQRHETSKKYCCKHLKRDSTLGAAKKVPIQLLPNPSEVIQRLLQHELVRKHVQRHQFEDPSRLDIKDVKPLVKLYVNYPNEARTLFSDKTIDRVRQVVEEFPLLLKHVQDKKTIDEGGSGRGLL